MKKLAIKARWQTLNTLYRLLVVNLAVFVVLSVLHLFAYLFGVEYIMDIVVSFFSFPADPLKFLFHLWTPFTYMFVHVNFMSFLSNMLWLYFLGLIFTNYFSQKHLWHVFLLSGLSGAFLFFISFNIFPTFWILKSNYTITGSLPAVSGIVLAAVVYRPKDQVNLFGVVRIPLWGIGALFVLFEMLMTSYESSGDYLAHLGGVAFGVIFALQYKRGKDITAWLDNLSFSKPKKRVKKNMRVVKNDYRPQDYEWNAKQKQIREEVDRILEKISKYGYNSLSKKEREFLRIHSKDYDGFNG